jgi:hypothetical protein
LGTSTKNLRFSAEKRRKWMACAKRVARSDRSA